MSHGIMGSQPWEGALTKAAGDDFRAVLRENERVYERKIHGGGAESSERDRQGARLSAGSIFTGAAAVHARRVKVAFWPSRVPAVDVVRLGRVGLARSRCQAARLPLSPL
jgi:hypothetical protein